MSDESCPLIVDVAKKWLQLSSEHGCNTATSLVTGLRNSDRVSNCYGTERSDTNVDGTHTR